MTNKKTSTQEDFIVPKNGGDGVHIKLSVLSTSKNKFFLEREDGEGMEINGHILFTLLNNFKKDTF